MLKILMINTLRRNVMIQVRLRGVESSLIMRKKIKNILLVLQCFDQ